MLIVIVLFICKLQCRINSNKLSTYIVLWCLAYHVPLKNLYSKLCVSGNFFLIQTLNFQLVYTVDEKKLREVFRLAGRCVTIELSRDKVNNLS